MELTAYVWKYLDGSKPGGSLILTAQLPKTDGPKILSPRTKKKAENESG